MRLLCIALLVFFYGTAHAAVVINATQTGGDVVFSVTGSYDATELGNFTGGPFPTNVIGLGIVPNAGDFVLIVGGGLVSLDRYASLDPLPVFGTNGAAFASTSSGSNFVITGTGLHLPSGYSADDPISSSMTFSGATFASLGLTPGTYLYTYNGVDTAATLNIIGVPEPKAFSMLALAGLGMLLQRRRGRKRCSC